MMRFSWLTVVAVLGVTAGAPSWASTPTSVHSNGLSMNGVSMNGVSMNGVSMNGVVLNGVVLNGVVLNGLALERSGSRAPAAGSTKAGTAVFNLPLQRQAQGAIAR
jgi:hypothetical protein